MNATTSNARVLLFPLCDSDGLLLDALGQRGDGPTTRADALLFGWMLGLNATVDAVGAARAVLAVAAQQKDPPQTAHRRALIAGLERFVAEGGRVASLSSSRGGTRPRQRWRSRIDGDGTGTPANDARREERRATTRGTGLDLDGKSRTRRR